MLLAFILNMGLASLCCVLPIASYPSVQCQWHLRPPHSTSFVLCCCSDLFQDFHLHAPLFFSTVYPNLLSFYRNEVLVPYCIEKTILTGVHSIISHGPLVAMCDIKEACLWSCVCCRTYGSQHCLWYYWSQYSVIQVTIINTFITN